MICNMDDNEFKKLMIQHVQHVFHFARQYVRNNDDAEDITQETFFKVWKNIKKFKPGSKFKPWLFTIARNTALDHIKRKRASTFSEFNNNENDLAFTDTLASHEPSPQDDFEHAEITLELLEATNTLHPDHKAVMVMHYHQDMTFEEIAQVTGKPMNTVKSWHQRSILKLRTSILNKRLHQNV